MHRNVFLKSALRQPLSFLLLAVMVGAAAFAFVARAVEYIIVDRELRRIESYFTAIGVLSPLYPHLITDITRGHNINEAADVVAASPHVHYDDRRYFIPAVMHGFNNSISEIVEGSFMSPFLEQIDSPAMDMYIIGRALAMPRLGRHMGSWMIWMQVQTIEPIVADTSIFREPREFVSMSGAVTLVRSLRIFNLLLTDEEARLFRTGEWSPLVGMNTDDYFLFRVSPNWTGGFLVRPLGADDGIYRTINTFDTDIDGQPLDPPVQVMTHDLRVDPNKPRSEMIFNLPAADTARLDAMLASLEYELALASDNLSTITLTATRDMYTMPRTMDRAASRLIRGRWLNQEDYELARPVVVINSALYARRGIRLGDTLTVSLHDVSRPAWIDEDTLSTWPLGIEGWWAPIPDGWWSVASYLHTGAVHELELEVVGVYRFAPSVGNVHNFHTAEAFVPASLLPEGFGWSHEVLLTGMYSFVLTHPRMQENFMSQTETALADLGFRVRFLPSGFETFRLSADPINLSIRLNLVVYTIASIVVLALVVFLYLWPRRKSIAIDRALGTPAGRVLLRMWLPALIWLPMIFVGSAFAWWFALNQAAQTLAEVGYAEGYLMLDAVWMFVFAGGISVVLFVAFAYAGVRLVSRPVLAQLQGDDAKRHKIKAVADTDPIPTEFSFVGVVGESSHHAKLSAAYSSTLRFCARHIVRSPLKTVLTGGLALIFVFSLGWLYNTIAFTMAEIDRLYNETVITAEIVPDFGDDRLLDEATTNLNQDTWVLAPISQDSLDFALDLGFVDHAYLEALWMWSALITNSQRDLVRRGVPLAELDEEGEVERREWFLPRMFGINDLDGFVRNNTRTMMDDVLGIFGDDMTIEFAPGFSADDFVFTQGEPMPLIVRRVTLERMTPVAGLALGETAVLYDPRLLIALETGSPIHPSLIADRPINVRVIGVFDGGLSRGAGRFDTFVSAANVIAVPLDGLRHFVDTGILNDRGWGLGGVTYSVTYFTLDPIHNRELSEFRDRLRLVLPYNNLGQWAGTIPLELLMDDSIFDSVIGPLEQNLSLLRVLFPIAVGVALVLGFGLTFLIMLLNGMNAAVLRVLGKTKSAARMLLCAEQLIVIAGGVFAGLFALAVFGQSVGFVVLGLASMYVAGTVAGLVVGSALVCAKTPLELLQVRE